MQSRAGVIRRGFAFNRQVLALTMSSSGSIVHAASSSGNA
jgi:hypothetical protein